MISLLVYFSVQNGTVVKQTSSLHGILPMAMQLRTTQAVRINNKAYVRPANTLTVGRKCLMYAGRVACCPLVGHASMRRAPY